MPDFDYTNRDKVIEVTNLYKSFGDNHVLKGIDIDVYDGENLVVLGRSGTGKSVLIKCMVGLLKPDRGTMKILGEEVTELDSVGLDELRRDIGFSFQGSALYDSMSVRENLLFPLERNQKNLTQSEKTHKIEEALDNVGLLSSIDLMPSELSGGMKKRVGVARTLILNPKIMLYDEPTAGLDPITAKEINELIIEVQRLYQTSAIIITHDITCARMTGNRIAALTEGYCELKGTYDELKALEDPRLKPFFEY